MFLIVAVGFFQLIVQLWLCSWLFSVDCAVLVSFVQVYSLACFGVASFDWLVKLVQVVV